MHLALLLLTFGLNFLAAPVKPNQPDYALATVRMVNTAESYAHRARGKYLPLDQLISSGSLKQAAAMNPDFGSAYSQLKPEKGPEILDGFDLGMLVSFDGAAYKFSLDNKERCGTTYFSDERGLIYAGRPLGCSP
jgi:hypothetical protein